MFKKADKKALRAKRHLRVRKDLKVKAGGNKEAAKMIGEAVAKRALDKGITEVVFDRGGYVYHGRVQALAEAAREAGLKF